MSYRELVSNWNEGVLAVEKGDWESALNIFRSIAKPSSKIDYNIGCLHLQRGELEQALKAFNQTVSKDNCLAVGFFQRGYVYLRLERYEEALKDYRLALEHLRNNTCIDYRQLGLKFVLCAWEVVYNTAAAHCRLGKWQDAQQVLKDAAGQTPKGQRSHLEFALERVQEHLFLEPRSVPLGQIFTPPAKDVQELQEKDFLGKSKVISFAFEEDEGNASHNLQPKDCYNPGLDPSWEQGHGYHRLVAPYPEKEGTLKAGSIIYVLSARPDNHVMGIYNGQKIFIPASHLEPVDLARTGEEVDVSTGIPLPPGKVPPSRPHAKQKIQEPGPMEKNRDWEEVNHTGANSPQTPKGETTPVNGHPILLKVHASYTVDLKVSITSSLADLNALLQEECCRQTACMSLRYKPPESDELIPIKNDEELRSIWQKVQGGHLTLWCQAEESSTDRPVLYRMVAHHPYAAQALEDLSFKEGDQLEILSEVNEEWLEGRCNGTIGIFPKCFAVRESAATFDL